MLSLYLLHSICFYSFPNKLTLQLSPHQPMIQVNSICTSVFCLHYYNRYFYLMSLLSCISGLKRLSCFGCPTSCMLHWQLWLYLWWDVWFLSVQVICMLHWQLWLCLWWDVWFLSVQVICQLLPSRFISLYLYKIIISRL